MRNKGDIFGNVESIPLLIQMHEEVSVALLGILSGAMLVIGIPIVGYWQSLPPDAFLDTFGQHATRINSLVLPLTIIAVLITAITAAAMWMTRAPNRGWFVAAAVFSIAAALLHPFYFMKANQVFAAAQMAPDAVAAALSSWITWQWVRIGLCFAALVSSIRGLRASDLATLTQRAARRVAVTLGSPEHPQRQLRPRRAR